MTKVIQFALLEPTDVKLAAKEMLTFAKNFDK